MLSFVQYRFLSGSLGPLTALRRYHAGTQDLHRVLSWCDALRVVEAIRSRTADRTHLVALAGLLGPLPLPLKRAATSYLGSRVLQALKSGDIVLVTGWEHASTLPQPRRATPRRIAPVAPATAPAPPPKAQPTPKPRVVERPVCAVVSISALCSHKRKVKGGGVLEIVPGKSLGSDVITLDDHLNNPHGDDPKWTLSTGNLNGKSFKATGPTSAKLWIPSISPRSYVASCSTCSGSSESLTIHAYPNNELKAEVDLDKILKIVDRLTDWFKELLNIVTEKVEFEVMHVKGSFGAQWKEAEDWRAFYAYKIVVEGTLLKASIKQMIGPSKIVNIAKKIPGIGKYLGQVIDWLIKAGIYIEIGGAVKVSFKFERTKPDQPRLAKNLGGGVGGGLDIALGVMASVLHDEVIVVKLEAKGGATFEGEGELGEHGGIEITPKIDFDGLKGQASVKLLRGWITFSEGLTFVEPRTLWKGEPWEIGATEHEGEAAHAE